MEDLTQVFLGSAGAALLYVGYQVFRTLLSKTPDPRADVTKPLVDLAASLTSTFKGLTEALNNLSEDVRNDIAASDRVHRESSVLLQALVTAAGDTAKVLQTVVGELRNMKIATDDTRSRLTAEERAAALRHAELSMATAQIANTQRAHTEILNEIRDAVAKVAEASSPAAPTTEKETPNEA